MVGRLAVALTVVFRCHLDGDLSLVVTSSPDPPFFPYSVGPPTGPAWLEGGGYAVSQSGTMFAPGAGLSAGSPSAGSGVDAALGAFTYFSIPWMADGLAFVTNFTCHTDFHLAALTASFPTGATGVATLPSQPMGSASLDGGNAVPSVHFPSFAASATTALRSPTLGFVEWAGEMDSYSSKHGVALESYGGGQQSGPLLLFNKSQLVPGASKPQALVLGPGLSPGAHIAHSILGLVADPAPPSQSELRVAPACSYAPHTDEVGGNSSPGTSGGIMVQAGNASACCEACAALGLSLCDSWVYDTDGTAGGANCWPLLGTKGSKQGMPDRVLGIMWPVTCKGQDGLAAVGGTPSQGFEAGLRSGGADACCVLCETLGEAACSAWQYNASAVAPAPDCFPLISYTSTSPSAAVTLGGASPRPIVLAAGVQGYVTHFPPGFASTFFLSAASSGLNDAVYRYGAALRAVARLERMVREVDPMRNLVSYWSDNGAMYFDGYWPRFFSRTNTAQDVFERLKADHKALGLTIGTYQVDPWWAGGACGSDGPPPPECAQPLAWPWQANWSAAPGFFPDGMAALGIGFTLYSNLYATGSLNLMTQFDWVDSSACTRMNMSTCGQGTPGWSRVLPSQSYDFHSYLMDAGVGGLAMNGFEVDFSDWMLLSFTDFSTDVRAIDEYFGGLNAASADHGMPTQLCMTLPAMTLNSVLWPYVTNARLQSDGYATTSGRYDIFQSSLLYGAVELAPFLDNVWTTSCQPALDNPFGNSTCEEDVEGLIIIATLGAGPVGLGDHVGFTNATLVNMTTRADGVLLQPSLPATNLEFWFADAMPAGAGSRARVTSAPSFIRAGGAPNGTGVSPFPSASFAAGTGGSSGEEISAFTFLSLFATFSEVDILLHTLDVWPRLPVNDATVTANITGYFATSLANRAQCVDGADVVSSGCAMRASGQPFDTLVTLTPGPSAHDMYSVSPIFDIASSGGDPGAAVHALGYAAGWSMLGELSKIARVSPSRVVSIEPGCWSVGWRAPPCLCATLQGGVNESVSMAFVDPDGSLHVFSTVLDGTGRAALSCECTSRPCGWGCFRL